MEYETQDQHQHKAIPDEAERKLGSAQRAGDPFDTAGTDPAGVPVVMIAPDQRPVEMRPREFLAVDTQPTDYITPESRPREVRPRDIAPY